MSAGGGDGGGRAGDGRAPAAVLVVVASYNTRELLALCLESLAGDVADARADVVVVDNDSADGSAAVVRERFPWASLVEAGENLGYGRAINLGVAAAGQRGVGVGGDVAAPPHAWIVAANADVAARPGALRALLAAGERDPGAGLLAPRLILPGGATQQSLHPFPTSAFAWSVAVGRGAVDRRWAAASVLDGRWDPAVARRVPWAEGAFVMVRRAAWLAVGGFDPSRFMYAEDVDLGWRLARAGWATRFVPDARVHHELSAATSVAFGDDRLERAWAQTYAWIGERLGPRTARSVRAANTAGAAVRWVARAAVGVVPGRAGGGSGGGTGVSAQEYRRWAELHWRAGRY